MNTKTHESRITFGTTDSDGYSERVMVTKHKSLALAEKYIAGFKRFNRTGAIVKTEIQETLK
jgi:hypothetical protein